MVVARKPGDKLNHLGETPSSTASQGCCCEGGSPRRGTVCILRGLTPSHADSGGNDCTDSPAARPLREVQTGLFRCFI